MNKQDRKELQDLFTIKAEEKESQLRDSYKDDTDWFAEALDQSSIRDVFSEAKHQEAMLDLQRKKFDVAVEDVRSALISQGRNAPSYLNYIENQLKSDASKLKEQAFAKSEVGLQITELRKLVKENRTQLIFIDQPSEVKELFTQFQVALEAF